jgi:hypothetical protein
MPVNEGRPARLDPAADHALIRKATREAGESAKGRLAIGTLRGTADVRINSDEIMALTRDEAGPRKRRNWNRR